MSRSYTNVLQIGSPQKHVALEPKVLATKRYVVPEVHCDIFYTTMFCVSVSIHYILMYQGVTFLAAISSNRQTKLQSTSPQSRYNREFLSPISNMDFQF